MKYERLLFVALTLVALPLLTTACRPVPKAPVISFTLVPVADPGGPESLLIPETYFFRSLLG